ncbi:MAG: hypothetical protein CFH01_01916 [Alphaproteobacteria bacterium MarineAlpha2_Bin1]|nr:MAG: hypothetical protein CFH01_01916 [Alphaproteobacteria bacterium MarineAlpha2_Bin1]|tara:strand:- start:807 stop:1169 length:363 start_codon:yes stop_codon:yes gene_type:complete
MITVYYDGKCNICSKEINYYKKIDSKNKFNWFDIANNPEKLIGTNIKINDALLYLHVEDQEGILYIGIDAFILIWKNLNTWKYLAYLISIPPLKKFAGAAYIKFAKYRYSKLSYCRNKLN